ncbi:hypothetical protein EMELA_v1c04090 [Mesoplasma melaleucae]|uniref:Uncharacterized protein n=1 Tax=Mesoplasma melaleucae TaxID=81459 RepID=A0A2K8NW32_9MOLU|nr:hypothetical protein EMELA_v1c04090 [Mesoplasma melaleucae]
MNTEHPEICTILTNLINKKSVIDAFNKIENDFNKVDVLIYNAGYANSKK